MWYHVKRCFIYLFYCSSQKYLKKKGNPCTQISVLQISVQIRMRIYTCIQRAHDSDSDNPHGMIPGSFRTGICCTCKWVSTEGSASTAGGGPIAIGTGEGIHGSRLGHVSWGPASRARHIATAACVVGEKKSYFVSVQRTETDCPWKVSVGLNHSGGKESAFQQYLTFTTKAFCYFWWGGVGDSASGRPTKSTKRKPHFMVNTSSSSPMLMWKCPYWELTDTWNGNYVLWKICIFCVPLPHPPPFWGGGVGVGGGESHFISCILFDFAV